MDSTLCFLSIIYLCCSTLAIYACIYLTISLSVEASAFVAIVFGPSPLPVISYAQRTSRPSAHTTSPTFLNDLSCYPRPTCTILATPQAISLSYLYRLVLSRVAQPALACFTSHRCSPALPSVSKSCSVTLPSMRSWLQALRVGSLVHGSIVTR
jgi:hypothetical protein